LAEQLDAPLPGGCADRAGRVAACLSGGAAVLRVIPALWALTGSGGDACGDVVDDGAGEAADAVY